MGCITIAMCCLIQNLFVEALHHQKAAPKLIDPTPLVNREVSELLSEVLSGISKSLLSQNAARLVKEEGCFPEMPRRI